MARFDVNLLDPEDPFEIDGGNRPHLYKHLPTKEGRSVAVGVDDILDIYLFGSPLYYPADLEIGDAHWLMYGEVPGIVLAVPLAPANSKDPTRCRPIGLYGASRSEAMRYFADLRNQGHDRSR